MCRRACASRSIAENGAVVSQFAPGTPPLPYRFPERNRVIAGLALAVVVVEATERSGALITLPYGDGGLPALRAAFEERHRQLYGYATGESIECVNLRLAAIGRDDWAMAPASEVPAADATVVGGSHPAFFPETGEVMLPRYDRVTLPVGATIAGPAMIEDEWSTVIVYPGQHAAADRLGNLIIEAVA